MKNNVITKEFEEMNNFISEIEKDKNQIDSNPLKEFYEKYDKIFKLSSEKVQSYNKDRLNLINSYNKKHNINNNETGKPVYGFQGNGEAQSQVSQNCKKSSCGNVILAFFQILFSLIPIAVCISFAIYAHKYGTSSNFGYAMLVILLSYPSLIISCIFMFNYHDVRHDAKIAPFIVGAIYAGVGALLFIFSKQVYDCIYNILNTLGAIWNWLIILVTFGIYGFFTYLLIESRD